MSVTKPNRETSKAQFVTTARELEKETRQRCVNGPKRYTFYGLQELWQTSRKIHSAVTKASPYPKTKKQLEKREELLEEALRILDDYNAQLSLLLDDQIFSPAGAKKMSTLMTEEGKLISGVMKSDRTRFANLL